MKLDEIKEYNLDKNVLRKVENLCKNKRKYDYDLFICLDGDVIVKIYSDEDKEFLVSEDYIKRVE